MTLFGPILRSSADKPVFGDRRSRPNFRDSLPGRAVVTGRGIRGLFGCPPRHSHLRCNTFGAGMEKRRGLALLLAVALVSAGCARPAQDPAATASAPTSTTAARSAPTYRRSGPQV